MVDRETWRKLGAAGLLGIATRKESGGIGGDFKSAMILMEEHSYENQPCGSTFGAHNEIVLPYLDFYATKEQKEKYIPGMISGETIGALALTEPSAGSDLQEIKTYAKREGDDWILNGSKTLISNGYLSDISVVLAVTDIDAKHKAHGSSLFLVESGLPGFTKGNILNKVGYHSSDTSELFFDDVRLPMDAVLGGEERLNKGFHLLMNQLPRERLCISILALSQAEYIFELTREYVKGRKAFGTSLSKLQTIQHRLAEMKTKICMTRAFTDRGYVMADEGTLDTVYASMAKAWASDLNFQVVDECLQLHGGLGYMSEYPVATAFIDSRLAPIFGGCNEVMYEIIARDIVA